MIQSLHTGAASEIAYSCTRKRRFVSEAVARAEAQDMIKLGNSDRPELWVYGCEVCRGWHMTKRMRRDHPSVTATDLFRMVHR